MVHPGVMDMSGIRIINVYDQVRPPSENRRGRPARNTDIMAWVEERTILEGNFNTHGHRWNDRLNKERNAGWVNMLMDSCDLVYVGDRVETCHTPNSEAYSVIDLPSCSGELATKTRARNLTAGEPRHASG
jgi:hypothetical protein